LTLLVEWQEAHPACSKKTEWWGAGVVVCLEQQTMAFWDAVPSAGPYTNNLHLAPDR